MSTGKVTVLGMNGHIGQAVAKAFVAQGWEVTGMARTDKHPIAGVRFVAGNYAIAREIALVVAADIHPIGNLRVLNRLIDMGVDEATRGAWSSRTATRTITEERRSRVATTASSRGSRWI